MRIKKGHFGYIDSQKKMEIIKTAILFALAFAIFIMGYVSTGKRENLLTVIAILGILPASRCAVSMIMFLRQKTGSSELYQEIQEHAGKLPAVYDLVITTKEKAYPVLAMVSSDHSLYGFVEKSGMDITRLETHLNQMLKQNKLPSVTIKIYEDITLYNSSLDSMNQKVIEGKTSISEEADDILSLIMALSL